MEKSFNIASQVAEQEAADGKLLNRITGGEEDALYALYEKYAPALYGITSFSVKSHAKREDMIHDIFLEVWNKPDAYKSERGTVLGWLVSKAGKRIIARRSEEDPLRYDGTGSLDFSSLHKERAENGAVTKNGTNDYRKSVAASLAALNAEQRQMLFSAFFKGYNCSEIAAEMKMPVDAVLLRLGNALNNFNSFLRGEVPDNAGHDEKDAAACAVFAVNSLDGDAYRKFDLHLKRGCDRCTTEIGNIRETSPLLVSVVPPFTMTQELKDRIAFSVHLSEAVKSASKSEKEIGTAGQDETKAEPPASKPKRPTLFIILLIAVLVMLIILSFDIVKLLRDDGKRGENGGDGYRSIEELAEKLEERNSLLEILYARDLHVVYLAGTEINPGGYGKLLWSPSLQRALLHTANLPASPPDTEYRLWMADKADIFLIDEFSVEEMEAGNSLFRVKMEQGNPAGEAYEYFITLGPKGHTLTAGTRHYLSGKSAEVIDPAAVN